MKNLSRKALALVLCAVMTVSSVVPALAATLGDEIIVTNTALNSGTELNQGVYWKTSSSAKQTENYVTYTPGTAVTPLVSYGNYVTQCSTVSAAARSLQSAGYRVVTGINASFFSTSNGVPIGLLLTRGFLNSADALYHAIGFKADGTAIIGKPNVWMSLDLGLNDGVSRSIVALNKSRGNYGIYMYTAGFNSAGTTGTTENGVDVILSMDTGTVQIGGAVTMTVESVTDNTKGTKVPAGKAILTANYKANPIYTDALKALKPGDTVKLAVSAASAAWNDVQYAVGSPYPLVLDGVVADNLSATVNPYTAVGTKADGTVIFYTLDGRKTGHSVGASQKLLAQRMLELGCVNALCLDGGGSTTMSATMPASTAASTINIPSDGRERAVTSQLFLVATNQASGVAGHYYVSPSNTYALAGANLPLTAALIDTNYIPMTLGTAPTYTVEGEGTMTDTTFTAPNVDGISKIIVTGDSGVTGSAAVTTVVTPDSISLTKDSNAVTSLTLAKDATVSLVASAIYNHQTLLSQNTCFKWAVTGDVGTITENGVFTATTAGNGTIAVTAGDKTVSIPVSVSPSVLNSTADGVALDADMLAADCTRQLGTALDYVTFTLPDKNAGALYYGYTTATKSSTAISGEDKFYLSTEPLIDDLKFIPKAGYSGSFDLIYTGYDTTGNSFTSKVTIVVTAKTVSTFTDVNATAGNAWAADSVDFLRTYGISTGQGNNTFGAAAQISRGDFMLMLYRAFALNTFTGASDSENFADVKSDSYYATAIAVAKSLGIAKGSDGNFSPTNSITRQDAMVLISRTMEAAGVTLPQAGSDVLTAYSDASDISDYAMQAVSNLVNAGVVKGSSGKLSPKNGITRAEMACILHRVLTFTF